MIHLYNQGYVVQGICQNIYTSLLPDFYGMDKYFSWPLEYEDTYRSNQLTDIAWNHWFYNGNSLETIPSIEYIKNYVSHCKELSIVTRILKVEAATPLYPHVEERFAKEELGFDCIAGVYISYLNIEPSYMKIHFPSSIKKLNQYGLFNEWKDANDFLEEYEKLRSSGENLEYGPNPLPVKLSIISEKDLV